MNYKHREETLDPENWEEFRKLGYKMLDEMIDEQRNIANKKFLFPPKQAIEDICIPLPNLGDGEAETFEVFQHSIRPYVGNGNAGPRFWAVVAGNGSPYGMLTYMLTAGLNTTHETQPSSAGFVHK